MARLVMLEGGGEAYAIDQDQIMIGRRPENNVQLLGGTVSGAHARIIRDGSSFFIEDAGSRNGTMVNGELVSSRVQLKDRDEIHFGQSPARFEITEVSSTAETKNPLLDPFATPSAASSSPLVSTTPTGDLQAKLSQGRLNDVMISADDSAATITGAVQSKGRFGALESNPEAKLKAVLEISTALAGNHDLQDILPKVLDALFRIFKYADRGCVLLKDDASGEMVPRAIKHRRASDDATVRLSRTIVTKVLEEKTGILSADASSDAQFTGSESIADLKIRSMMCVPLLSLNNEPIGVLSIDSQNPLGQFSNEDLDILMVVAGQAALSYESARLLQTYLEKRKQDNEMDIAQGIQRALLPDTLPQAEGYEFFASYDAAQAVGGDYYDSFLLPDKKVCLSFGDVAGKGVPGALIMSRMHSCVQSTMRHVHDVEGAMEAINDHMCDTSVEGRFVTYVLVIIDTETNELVLSNAGHMSPLIRHADGSVEQFDDELVGPPIGVMDGYPYEIENKTLEVGDIVVITTDGVDEAMNPDGELYGTERVIEFVKNGPESPAEMGKRLLADVRRHADGRDQNDDITIMTFGRIA